jgi:hypothetical protein
MKKEVFTMKLCNQLEDRILEICKKFYEGNFNEASLYVFWIGLSGDIQSFLDKNKLMVVKRNI